MVGKVLKYLESANVKRESFILASNFGLLFFRSQFSNCKLRVFSLANRADELARETRK
jgi:hypothetical protein